MKIKWNGAGFDLLAETDDDRKVLDDFLKYRDAIQVETAPGPGGHWEINLHLPDFQIQEARDAEPTH